mmetsp:Transcript_705/g.1444  ORF Transcript_705/g.1444 Transcript_705/m.1444 type:complete len:215 (-) Transcript_705:90-734(-)
MHANTLVRVASLLLRPMSSPLHGRAAIMSASIEFSRPIGVDRKQKYQRVELSASPEECASLCKRFDLEGIDSLQANVSISRVRLTEQTLRVRATGSMTGIGVSRKNFGGERVTLDVQGIDFEAYYATEAEDDAGGGELDMSNDEAFDEPIVNGEIDLGELVAQQLYLHLSELTLQEAGEWTDPDSVKGSVYYDTEPGAPDIGDSGGTLGERLGF